jgi:ribA/ribD-fused uncharacterized protein
MTQQNLTTRSGFNGKYRFLSNFYPSVVEFEGIVYPTVEHAYQAAKTLDQETRRQIAQAFSAAVAKKTGRTIYLREDWDDVKDSIMLRLLRKKFRNDGLAGLLLDTGDLELVEYNYWHDRYWGVCECAGCGSVGKNMLGQFLMQVREELNEQGS